MPGSCIIPGKLFLADSAMYFDFKLFGQACNWFNAIIRNEFGVNSPFGISPGRRAGGCKCFVFSRKLAVSLFIQIFTLLASPVSSEKTWSGSRSASGKAGGSWCDARCSAISA